MTGPEIVDVVDAEDRVIGSLPRAELAARGAGHRVVHVLVLDGNRDLILQRPSPERSRAFLLGSSVAGHVLAGESYDAAAAREFEEELGVTPPPLRSLGKTWVDAGHRRKFVGVYLASDVRMFAPDPREVARLEHVPISEVRRLLRQDPCPFSDTFVRVFRHADAQGCFV